jgi:uncharacterized membrane protein
MEYKHTLPTLAELREMRTPAKHSRKEAKVSFSLLEKFALFVTRAVGSMGFFFILTFWTAGWLLWNLLGPVELRFDPAPAFVIWLFASNIIQLILLPLIMVGQNLEGKFAEHRAQSDYEINKKSEYEIEVVLAHLENQNELLLEILRKTNNK